MIGPSHISSFMDIGPVVPEKKIFEGFLPYMVMAAILVKWLRPFEQTFVSPVHRGSTWNLTSIGPVVSEKKMFENVDRQTEDRRQQWGLLILSAHQWAKGLGELIISLVPLPSYVNRTANKQTNSKSNMKVYQKPIYFAAINFCWWWQTI